MESTLPPTHGLTVSLMVSSHAPYISPKELRAEPPTTPVVEQYRCSHLILTHSSLLSSTTHHHQQSTDRAWTIRVVNEIGSIPGSCQRISWSARGPHASAIYHLQPPASLTCFSHPIPMQPRLSPKNQPSAIWAQMAYMISNPTLLVPMVRAYLYSPMITSIAYT